MPGKEIKGRSKRANYRNGGGPGLYANIATKGAPTAANFARAKQTAKS